RMLRSTTVGAPFELSPARRLSPASRQPAVQFMSTSYVWFPGRNIDCTDRSSSPPASGTVTASRMVGYAFAGAPGGSGRVAPSWIAQSGTAPGSGPAGRSSVAAAAGSPSPGQNATVDSRGESTASSGPLGPDGGNSTAAIAYRPAGSTSRTALS